ncbi:MAG: hypothetical protein MK078_02730 [Crocinitomicaceae bacterium]|nr:hypothetical protein [Crocinitomicaceae bacterium]
MLKFFRKILVYSLVILVCFEAALWILGYRPYSTIDYKVFTNPPNAYQGDSALGLRLNPGEYIITLNDHIEFTAHHLDNGQRNVGPHAQTDELRPNIHFYGCSYTYGYGVNDNESFVSLTQEHFNSNAVANHAVIGYGTVQSLLQLRDENISPNDLVLLVLSSQHLIRNTLAPEYRSSLKIGFENSSEKLEKNMRGAHFPFMASCDKSIEFLAWEEVYENWPLRELSSTINFLQTTADKINGNEENQILVTECLLDEMFKICKIRNASFAVICLDNDEKTSKIAQNLPHIPWIDINFDFTSNEYTNTPFDQHPNEEGHELIAETIIPFIDKLLK